MVFVGCFLYVNWWYIGGVLDLWDSLRDCYLRGTWIRIPKHFQPSVFCNGRIRGSVKNLRCAAQDPKKVVCGPISVAQEIGFRFRLRDFCGKKPWVSQRSLRKELFLGTHKKSVRWIFHVHPPPEKRTHRHDDSLGFSHGNLRQRRMEANWLFRWDWTCSGGFKMVWHMFYIVLCSRGKEGRFANLDSIFLK